MFLEERAAFGSLEEGDSSVLVFCILIIPSIMALSLFKDKVLVSKVDWQIMMEVTQVLMKMISASLPSAEQSNDMTMRILERALEAFDGLWNTCGFFSTVTLPWGVFINLRDSFPSGEVKWSLSSKCQNLFFFQYIFQLDFNHTPIKSKHDKIVKI